MRASRPTVTVLTAQMIRPDYWSGQTFRHVVLADGTVSALAKTAAEAARAAGPSASWVDLGSACVGPGFIDTHIHALHRAARYRDPLDLAGGRAVHDPRALMEEERR